jgi:hypothetical protein
MIFVCFSMIFVSCGNNDEDQQEAQVLVPSEQVSPGIFKAILFPVNKNLVNTSGQARMNIDGDAFDIGIEVNKTSGNISQKQFVFSGPECPSSDHDENGDGFIDINEAQVAIGKVLFPLDSIISDIQEDDFPESNLLGTYQWSSSASLSSLIANLKDHSKMDSERIINLEGKVIILQGVSSEVKLPLTVTGSLNQSAHESLPVSCGIIKMEESSNIDSGGNNHLPESNTTTGGYSSTGRENRGDEITSSTRGRRAGARFAGSDAGNDHPVRSIGHDDSSNSGETVSGSAGLGDFEDIPSFGEDGIEEEVNLGNEVEGDDGVEIINSDEDLS